MKCNESLIEAGIPEPYFFPQLFQTRYSRLRISKRESETGQLTMQLFPEQGTLGFILNFAVDHQLEFSNFRFKSLLINMVYSFIGDNKQKNIRQKEHNAESQS